MVAVVEEAGANEEAAVGGKPKEVARRAAARLSGWTQKEVYAMLMGQETG